MLEIVGPPEQFGFDTVKLEALTDEVQSPPSISSEYVPVARLANVMDAEFELKLPVLPLAIVLPPCLIRHVTLETPDPLKSTVKPVEETFLMVAIVGPPGQFVEPTVNDFELTEEVQSPPSISNV